MKIQVKNLGVLNEVEIDLKPMTIFVGPNNSGKTLLAYVILAIFGETGLDRYKSALDRGKIAQLYPPLDEAIQQLIDEGDAIIDLCTFADEYTEVYINAVAQDVKRWFAEFMQVEQFSFDNLEIKLGLEEEKEQILQRILSCEIDEGIGFGQQRKDPLVGATKRQGDRILSFHASGSTGTLPEDASSQFMAKTVFETIHKGIYSNTHVFPATRASFLLNIPGVNGPGMLFADLMSRSIFGNLDQGIERYRDLAQILQTEILRGNLEVVPGEKIALSRKLVFKPREDVVLEVNMFSSMIKELAPLALYLKYSAQPGELLVMDEPEMNLHPEGQVQLTELLAMLVKAGIPVLLTTHSPYVLDHLTNLMKASKHEDKELIKEEFYLEEPDAFISKENVAFYLFEDGTAKNILREDGLIEWGIFGDVSDRITQIYFHI